MEVVRLGFVVLRVALQDEHDLALLAHRLLDRRRPTRPGRC
jgi:hypothetical protein